MHKSSTFFLLTIISLFIIVPVAAEASLIYNSGDLSTGRWHVHFSTHAFQAENPVSGSLEITKTTPELAIQAGFVILNRKLVSLKHFLNAPENTFQKKIELLQRNRLRVFLIGSPGASISVRIHTGSENPPATVDFSATPATINAGSASTLTWASANADTCRIEPGIGSVETSGSLTVAPQSTTTYTITVDGPGGSTSTTVTVVVNVPASTVALSASPNEITRGNSTTLAWSSANADSCLIDPDVGMVDTIGSISINPVETTTYTITASGIGGTAAASVTVVVLQPAPSVDILASPDTITVGESVTITWHATHADSCVIQPDIGTVAPIDSMVVSPEISTTYTITATSPGGTSSAITTVSVSADVEPQPEGSFGAQYEDLVPTDATVEAYDPRRFALITGLVQDSMDIPIASVAVSIHSHPEYGTAFTDARGRFSIPVEGGAATTVVFKKSGLITAHRQVDVPWNDTVISETVQMITMDPVATTVIFDGNPDTVVTHRSTPVVDEFGGRSASMVFSGNNRAWLVDENGNDVQELTTITTRATEFATPESMPAKLPPNSAYTYCVELSVDEAQRVRFDKPVVTWVDNFLGFEVGDIVPVGYYDRDRGVWVPADNGVVVRLLDTDADGIVDALDADGDDLPDDLDADGSSVNEVQGLDDAGAYPPDATFWRVAVSHFTPWDCNWPYGPPTDAIGPNPNGEPAVDQQLDEDCQSSNCSHVENRSRIFHEDIPIPGTDMTLHYASNRVEGYKTIISVPASGEVIPGSLKSIIVRLEVAGRQFEQSLFPLPYQSAEFTWDGLDHLRRPVLGSSFALIRIGFVYDAVYYGAGNSPQAFSQAGNNITGIPVRQEMIHWKNKNQKIYSEKMGKEDISEGWALSSHHKVNSIYLSTLYKGDGTQVKSNVRIIETIAGQHTVGFSGDGGLATDASFNKAYWIAVDSTGNLFITDSNNHRIRMVDTNGIITTIAGNGSNGFSGDGGLATDASLNDPHGIAVDSAGNLFIADLGNNRIRMVDASGIITTVAGDGTYSFGIDDILATDSSVASPGDVAVDDTGNVYMIDQGTYRIRKVDPSGFITTVAGNGLNGFPHDGSIATNTGLTSPFEIVVDNSGNLFFTDYLECRIFKVDTSGIISTVAGTPRYGFSGDGGPAIEAEFRYPSGIALDSTGNIFIADTYNNCIRMVNSYGIITTVAGNTDFGFSGDGGCSTNASIYLPFGVAVGSTGNLFIADTGNHCIREVAPPSIFNTSMTAGDIPFAEKNGLGHIMSSSGRHKTTIDLDTRAVLREFSYDENNKLISITDPFNNQTTIDRDGDGLPTSITSPDGLTTWLAIDADNHLTHVTHPDGSFYEFEYTDDGLLTAKIDPEGNRYEHQFNAWGRLTDSSDDEGGHWNYIRTVDENGDILSQLQTGEGNFTTYQDHTDSTGAYTSTITDPTGAETLYSRSGDGLTVNKSLPCGMDLDFKYDLDPEYKYKFIKEATETTPNSLERVTIREKTYQDDDSDDVPDLITETVTVNGGSTTVENNVLQSQKTVVSPEGRTIAIDYNPTHLLMDRISLPELFDTTYDYDDRGRLTAIQTYNREIRFSHDTRGNLETVTNPQGHTTTYDYDAIGRVSAVYRPDGSSLYFSYDANGNMTVLTNPSGVSHDFGFNGVNRKDAYHTPLSGSYQYFFDADRRLVQTQFPSGKPINYIYDTTRLAQVQTPNGNIDLTYLCGTKIESTTKGSESITYEYDGKLVTSETVSGTLNQSLNWTYNNDFKVSSFTYAGESIAFDYDNDGLLIESGAYTIFRNSNNGLPENLTDGNLVIDHSFNGYGELVSKRVTIGGSSAIEWDLTRDNNGRIITKTETAAGVTSNYAYAYDSMGRLETVSLNDAQVESYSYDLNGTRISETNLLRNMSDRNFSYSNEDHLLTTGAATYQYDADGFLTSKTDGAHVTTYHYSLRGELLRLDLPDGRVVTYEHDPLGRRIAKRINATIVEKYLWQGMTRLLAVYDGSDNLITRFEYADARMPVAMTQGSATFYLAYDQVGTLRLVIDTSGNMVKQIDYDSFGNILSETNMALKLPFGFAGGLHDRDTGLVRFGYRDYDPDTGRWTAKDPIGFAGGDTDLYGYVHNNPINFVDPTGEFGIIGATVGAIGGAIGGAIVGGLTNGVEGAVSGFVWGGVIGGAVGFVTGPLGGVNAGTILSGIVQGTLSDMAIPKEMGYGLDPCGEGSNP